MGRRSPEYSTWTAMRRRCSERAEGKERSAYYERGIRVCEQWQSFEAFLRDVGRRPSPGHTLDRIDNDGNYEPGNCRWATAKEQNRNRRDNVTLTIDGAVMCLAEITERFGISRTTIWRRYHQGLRDRDLVAPAMRKGFAITGQWKVQP